MKLIIVSVAHKVPQWVVAGWDEFIDRLPQDWSVHIKEVKPEPRTTGKTAQQMMAAEAQRIEHAIHSLSATVIALDETGLNLTTMQFAQLLSDQADRSSSIVLVIGGPDGLDPAFKQRCDRLIRLSSMTLPHALVRVVLAEQIYRAWSISTGHPYHRA